MAERTGSPQRKNAWQGPITFQRLSNSGPNSGAAFGEG